MLLLGLLYAQDPARGGLYPPCPFHFVTGLHCPGCGTLRALHQLLHGNLRAALGLNPAAVVALPFVAGALLAATRRRLTGRQRTPLRPAWIGWALLAGVLGWWVLRNLVGIPS